MKTELARRNMLTQQFRTCDILDDALLTILQSTPREEFVPIDYESFAFSDYDIPIGHDESMLNPLIEAKILNTLSLSSQDTVLEIGTGSAYLTTLMGKLAKKVTSLDIYEDFLHEASQKLSNHGVHNVELIESSGINGFEKGGTFDAIVYTGALTQINEKVFDQLNAGGRLFAVIGHAPNMQAFCFTKHDQGTSQKALFETEIKPLSQTKTSRFVF